MTDVPFVMHADFRLTEVWAEITDEVESGRGTAEADVTLPSHLVDALTIAIGAKHVDMVGEAGEGRTRLRVTSNTPEMLARQLAGWSPDVEVIGPREVRVALAELGRALAQQYSHVSVPQESPVRTGSV